MLVTNKKEHFNKYANRISKANNITVKMISQQ